METYFSEKFQGSCARSASPPSLSARELHARRWGGGGEAERGTRVVVSPPPPPSCRFLPGLLLARTIPRNVSVPLNGPVLLEQASHCPESAGFIRLLQAIPTQTPSSATVSPGAPAAPASPPDSVSLSFTAPLATTRRRCAPVHTGKPPTAAAEHLTSHLRPLGCRRSSERLPLRVYFFYFPRSLCPNCPSRTFWSWFSPALGFTNNYSRTSQDFLTEYSLGCLRPLPSVSPNTFYSLV